MGIMRVYCIDGMLFDYVDEAQLGKIPRKNLKVIGSLTYCFAAPLDIP